MCMTGMAGNAVVVHAEENDMADISAYEENVENEIVTVEESMYLSGNEWTNEDSDCRRIAGMIRRENWNEAH